MENTRWYVLHRVRLNIVSVESFWVACTGKRCEESHKAIWKALKKGLPQWLSGKEPACQRLEMCIWSLHQEDPLEEERATHSSILAWRIPWTEPGGLQSMGHKELDTAEATERTRTLKKSLLNILCSTTLSYLGWFYGYVRLREHSKSIQLQWAWTNVWFVHKWFSSTESLKTPWK